MSGADDREPRAGLLLGLALLVVAAVYAKALGGPFLWDDRRLILDSSLVQQLDVVGVFQRPFFGDESAAYYRPLTLLSLLFDFWLHGANSTGFHLTNLVVHLAATALLFGLLGRRGVRVGLAFLLSLAWALLPRLTEGAAWISGRGDVLASALSLLAVWFYRPRSGWRLAGSVFIGFCALMAKETGVGALLALLILELAGKPTTARRSPLQWGRLACIVAPLTLYGALRGAAGALSAGDGVSLGVTGRALASLEALGRYAFMLLNPLQPRTLLGQLGQASWPFISVGAVALVLLVLLGWRRWRTVSAQTLAYGALGALPLLMVLHLTALPVTVVAADRYLYLPTAALLLAAAPALQKLSQRKPRLMAGLLALTCVCGVRTFQRLGEYASEPQFWTTAVLDAPDDATALIELGGVVYRAGMFDEALVINQRALPLKGGFEARALDNTALSAAVCGRRALAAKLGDDLIRRFRDRPEFLLRRATIALNALELEHAARHAQRALAIAPGLEEAQVFLALLEGIRAAQGRGTPADALEVDAKAMRYPELEQRWLGLLEARKDEATLRRAIEVLIGKADPRRVRPLLERYAEQPAGRELERLRLPLQWRLDTVSETQEQLRRLPFSVEARETPASG